MIGKSRFAFKKRGTDLVWKVACVSDARLCQRHIYSKWDDLSVVVTASDQPVQRDPLVAALFGPAGDGGVTTAAPASGAA